MSDIKQKLTVSVFESLLKPSTDYLGGELKGFFQNRIESAKSKREEDNLLAHLESVRQKSVETQDTELSYAQLELFEHWTVEVEKIDPADKTLSGIWHSLLLNSKDSFNSEILMSKLKELSSGDAAALLKVFNRKQLSREDRYRLKSLKNLELVEQDEFKLGLIQFIFLLLIFGSLISTVLLVYSPPSVISELSKPITTIFAFLPLVLSGVTCISIYKYLKAGNGKVLKIWRLTWLGDRLVSLNRNERL